MSDQSFAVEIEHRLRERAYARALGDPEQVWLAREQFGGAAIDVTGVGRAVRAVALTLVSWVLR